MPIALDSGAVLAVPSRRARGIGRYRQHGRLDIIAFDTVAKVEYGETSILDSMVEPATVRATREREE
jgi:hypothetical protein